MTGILAIDLGDKQSGFASADALRISSQPLDPVRAPLGRDGEASELFRHIARLLEERDVSILLLGLPVSMDGRPGPRAALTERFAARLRERFPDCEVVCYDERLTTKEAEHRLREAGLRGRAAWDRKDSWSAWVLLQDWIDSGEPRQRPESDAP